MLVPNLVIFYVEDPLKSAEFYKKILSIDPSTCVPSFVAFTFNNGFHLAFWSTKAKDFTTQGEGNRSELSFMVKDTHEVRRLYNLWKELNIAIEQDLHEAVFGPTFVVLDPDGHRIRVCVPD